VLLLPLPLPLPPLPQQCIIASAHSTTDFCGILSLECHRDNKTPMLANTSKEGIKVGAPRGAAYSLEECKAIVTAMMEVGAHMYAQPRTRIIHFLGKE
jgi:hypothetical protein